MNYINIKGNQLIFLKFEERNTSIYEKSSFNNLKNNKKNE